MPISLQDAVERAKLSNDNEGYLSQYMYSNLLSSLDQTEQHAFAMALVDSGVQVKTGSVEDEEFSSREIFALMKTQADQFKQSPGGLWVPDSYDKPEDKPQEDLPERNIKSPEKTPDKTPEPSPQDDSEFESQDIQESTQNLIIAFDVDFGQNPENDKFLNFLPLDQADSQSQVGGANVFYFENIPKDSKITNALENLGKYAGDSFYAIRTDNSTGKDTTYGKRSELMPEERIVQDSDIVDEEPLQKPVDKAPEVKKTPENLSQGSPKPLIENKPKGAPEKVQQAPKEVIPGAPKPLIPNESPEQVKQSPGKKAPVKQAPVQQSPVNQAPSQAAPAPQAKPKKAPSKGKGKAPVETPVSPQQAVEQAPVAPQAPVEQPSVQPPPLPKQEQPAEQPSVQPPPLPQKEQPVEEPSDEFENTNSVEYIQEILEKNNLHVDKDGTVSLYSSSVPGRYVEKGDLGEGQGGKKSKMPLDKAVQYYKQQVNSTDKEQKQVSSMQDTFASIKKLQNDVTKFSYSERAKDPFIAELGKYLKQFKQNLDKFEVDDMLKKLDVYNQKQYDRNSNSAEIFDALSNLQQLKKEDPKQFQKAVEGLGSL